MTAAKLSYDDAARTRARPGLYFGWRVVLALFLCVSSLVGVALYSFIMFAEPLSQQFGWTAAQTGNLVSAMWLVGPLSLVSGPIIQRFGPWRLLVAGTILQVIALVLIGLVTAFWQMYLIRVGMGVGKIVIMLSVPVIVARWFDGRFATAMSLVWAGGAAGGLVMSPVTERVTTAFGWQAATLILAAGMAGVLLVAGILVRGASRPADLGLQRDGAPLQAAHASEPSREEPRIASRSLFRGRNLAATALMCFCVYTMAIVAIAIQTQEPAIFARAGLSPRAGAGLLGLTAGAALVGSILGGWMLDRVNVRWSGVLVAITIFGGILCLALARPGAHGLLLSAVAAAAVGYGLGHCEVIWINRLKLQFGTAAFATAYGFFYFSYQAGFASGGYLGGAALDGWGVAGLLLGCALLYLPATLVGSWSPPRVSAPCDESLNTPKSGA